MSPKDWEKALIDAYCDYRWHKLLDPLCETFQAWKAGEIGIEQVDQALDRAYQQKCALNNLFCQRLDRVWNLIHWWDREWFEAWVAKNHPPASIKIDTA
ncbi:MAG: hypothetical protein ACOYZ7_04595 [Chloroflexota bacterium]